ncbi:hypothetical protein FK531_22000 [Rhodococcus spelaei]|uniref:Uncharacterized protein n=1 Tax=Rhodococcus spelaei TaxID=2546320 RepID=A0A541AYZ9_9NOCA|nr:hypothetical protein [Rhodococcus spelaei]TQF65295.1 hypothetical protein FK531_22000 [Rhodococcus spelaei]
MGTFDSIKDVRAAVDENGGLLTVTLQDLREALGYAKLGARVLATISTELSGHGLGYFPADVLDDNPVPRRYDELRVFAKNEPIGELINAVLEPSERGDEKLLEVGGDNASVILDQIRTILET